VRIRATSCAVARCGEAGERDLDEHPRLQQLVELDRVGGEHRGDALADGQRDPLLGGRRHEDPAPGTLRCAHEVRAGQQP
jgi:hypothetical protein